MTNTRGELSWDELKPRIDAAFCTAGAGVTTNYFRQPFLHSRFGLLQAEGASLVFWNAEFDFHRLYWIGPDAPSIARLLEQAEFPSDTVAGCVGKAPVPEIEDALQRRGFRFEAEYRRFRHASLPVFPRNERLACAEAGEAEQLHAMLFSKFFKHWDHFPTLAVLRQWIAAGNVLVVRSDRRLCGFAIFQVQGKLLNYNFLYCDSPDPMEMWLMQRNLYAVVHERGARMGVLWINITNQGVWRMQEMMGWKPDGLCARYFRRPA